MTHLDRALAEISAIRGQMARATEFHGYGPATFAITGVLALAAGVIQAVWIGDPAHQVAAYLALWVGLAAVSAAIIGFEMVTRSRRIHSEMADEMIRAAVEQFLPPAAAGALITAVLVRFAPMHLTTLPGLWQITFGLGVFASLRFLPRAMAMVGAWYLGWGLYALSLSGGGGAYAPWVMAVSFGVGQLLVAGLLQRNHGGEDGER
jgi:hypothetical protein